MAIHAQLARRVSSHKKVIKSEDNSCESYAVDSCMACVDDCCDGVTGDWRGQVAAHAAAKLVT